jgi:SAM-dependent methyltransferase
MSDLSARIIDHYERHAFVWDAGRQSLPWIERYWHERFAAALPQGARVLDLGCGSGWPVARHLAERGLKVMGIDSSPAMISLCRSRLPTEEWIVGDMRSLTLGERFDGILAWDSFFHLNHAGQRTMFEVFAKHAAPLSLLMFNSGPGHGEAIGSYRGDPLYHASLAATEYLALLGQSGFEVVEHAVEDPKAGARTVWLAQSGLLAEER